MTKPNVFNIDDKMQLLFALTKIKRNPLEYSDYYIDVDCLTKSGDFDLELISKILSYANSFIHIHFKYSQVLIDNREMINCKGSSTQDDVYLVPYPPPKAINDWQYIKITTDPFKDWMDNRQQVIYANAILEPAYDKVKFTKLLKNRISVICNPEQFNFKERYPSEDNLNCKDYIIYIKQDNIFKRLDLMYEIFKYKLDTYLGSYIFLCDINNILYILSQEPISSISYFDNSTLKINNNFYKIK